MGHRKMPAYGEREHGGRYILDEYEWSRNHCKAGDHPQMEKGPEKESQSA